MKRIILGLLVALFTVCLFVSCKDQNIIKITIVPNVSGQTITINGIEGYTSYSFPVPKNTSCATVKAILTNILEVKISSSSTTPYYSISSPDDNYIFTEDTTIYLTSTN